LTSTLHERAISTIQSRGHSTDSVGFLAISYVSYLGRHLIVISLMAIWTVADGMEKAAFVGFVIFSAIFLIHVYLGATAPIVSEHSKCELGEARAP
jgi:hypothetical protein